MIRVIVEVERNLRNVMALDIPSIAPDESRLSPVSSLGILRSVMGRKMLRKSVADALMFMYAWTHEPTSVRVRKYYWS